ncbi:MAG: hypothetical protein LBE84_08935 [Planctomycetota bacterium]|jgi:hypothetical protein|nr:hypothetical protein [Planctomycetota bacterium]
MDAAISSEAGLVGSVDKFGVYSVDGFTLGNVESGEVFAKALPLPPILKERTENDKRLLDHFRKNELWLAWASS